ncbi:DUF7144 family membrane protein [Agromyces bauzanensis]
MQRRAERPKPPAPVVWVVVLAYALGVLDIAAGLVLILLRYDEEVRETGNAFTITWWGAAIIIAGLFVIAVASGLTRARRDARALATIGAGLSAFVAVIDVALDPAHPWFQLAVMAVALLVILALWTGRSGRFFREIRVRAHGG